MAKIHKGKSAPSSSPRSKSTGAHGGNRAGGRAETAARQKRGRQAAGKDPHRG